MNEAFLTYTKSKGNDLGSLVPGDRWCLCAGRWMEAWKDGASPRVILEATHLKTLDLLQIEPDFLRKDHSGYKAKKRIS
jgi:uncharacterized protein